MRVLVSSHRGGASQNPVHLDFARPGVRSKQREARRAQKAIRVSRSLAASPPMICVLPQVLWVFSALFNAGGWKHYRVKSFLFYLSVFWRPCPHVAPIGLGAVPTTTTTTGTHILQVEPREIESSKRTLNLANGKTPKIMATVMGGCKGLSADQT